MCAVQATGAVRFVAGAITLVHHMYIYCLVMMPHGTITDSPSWAIGLTGMYHTMGPYKSLLSWAQSATHGWFMEFHPSDGMGRLLTSTE